MNETPRPSPSYFSSIFLTPTFFFDFNLTDILALVPMDFTVHESFNAVGYNRRAATLIPVLSLRFLAVRERISFNESFNVMNFFALAYVCAFI